MAKARPRTATTAANLKTSKTFDLRGMGRDHSDTLKIMISGVS
jgi:hypothetical protein